MQIVFIFAAVSGLLTRTAQRAWVEQVWQAFGQERLLFGSNWPVSLRAGSYADVLAAIRPLVAEHGPEAERWFFAEAAQAAYRWRQG